MWSFKRWLGQWLHDILPRDYVYSHTRFPIPDTIRGIHLVIQDDKGKHIVTFSLGRDSILRWKEPVEGDALIYKGGQLVELMAVTNPYRGAP